MKEPISLCLTIESNLITEWKDLSHRHLIITKWKDLSHLIITKWKDLSHLIITKWNNLCYLITECINLSYIQIEGLGLWCLMSLLTIFQLYRAGQFY
jgi:hypothetical protein